MKQFITQDQLQELSFHAGNKLANWMHKKKYRNDGDYIFLSIGQMIEFLDEHKKIVNITRYTSDIAEGWNVSDVVKGTSIQIELCDALWEAVKNVLENYGK